VLRFSTNNKDIYILYLICRYILHLPHKKEQKYKVTKKVRGSARSFHSTHKKSLLICTEVTHYLTFFKAEIMSIRPRKAKIINSLGTTVIE